MDAKYGGSGWQTWLKEYTYKFVKSFSQLRNQLKTILFTES